jgi:hypothetical protein
MPFGSRSISVQKYSRKNFGNNWLLECVFRSYQSRGEVSVADKKSLRVIGFVIASITSAVMMVAIMQVHKTVAGELILDAGNPSLSASR